MKGVDHPPPLLGGLDQLERHRDPGGAVAGASGDPLPEPAGGEGQLEVLLSSSGYKSLSRTGSVSP